MSQWSNMSQLFNLGDLPSLPYDVNGSVAPQILTSSVTTPVLQTPGLQTPAVQTPVLQTPVVQTPVLQTPVLQTPVLQTPVLQTPVLQTPVLQTPVLPCYNNNCFCNNRLVQNPVLDTQTNSLHRHPTPAPFQTGNLSYSVQPIDSSSSPDYFAPPNPENQSVLSPSPYFQWLSQISSLSPDSYKLSPPNCPVLSLFLSLLSSSCNQCRDQKRKPRTPRKLEPLPNSLKSSLNHSHEKSIIHSFRIDKFPSVLPFIEQVDQQYSSNGQNQSQIALDDLQPNTPHELLTQPMMKLVLNFLCNSDSRPHSLPNNASFSPSVDAFNGKLHATSEMFSSDQSSDNFDPNSPPLSSHLSRSAPLSSASRHTNIPIEYLCGPAMTSPTSSDYAEDDEYNDEYNGDDEYSESSKEEEEEEERHDRCSDQINSSHIIANNSINRLFKRGSRKESRSDSSSQSEDNSTIPNDEDQQTIQSSVHSDYYCMVDSIIINDNDDDIENSSDGYFDDDEEYKVNIKSFDGKKKDQILIEFVLIR